MTSKPKYTKDSVTSQDGTIVGYRQLGSGPGLLLMHGGALASQHFMKLGEALQDKFTVYIPDRRGRGLSGPFGDNYGMQREMEDVKAITNQTGAHYIFGLSSGGLIALQAALKIPAIHKAALYEPPLDIDNSVMKLLSFIPDFDRELDEDKLSEATVTMLREFGIYFGVPSWLANLPRTLLVDAFKLYYGIDSKVTGADDVSYSDLVPTFHYDYELVREMQGTLDTFRDVRAEVLLIGGSNSPQFLKDILDVLEKVLANVKRVELKGINHSGPLVSGDPGRVAAELKKFF
ncbi:MAG TPA: alpha/beta hydrolase [Methanobacterium sp.]|nr:alpha/beta hydrolase [Methanobacterium sp.]